MQTLHVEDTDPRLEYGPYGAWTVQGDYHYSEAEVSQFFILFRGTGIKIYGQYGNDGSMLYISADGAGWAPISLNGTSDGTKQIWNITGLEDTDHQVLGLTNPQNGGNRIWIDYVELENAAGTGFDPLDSGANATSVPQEAMVVEATDSSIQYSPQHQWDTIYDVQYHGPNLARTNQSGASITFTFEGVAVWYYSDLGPPHAPMTASIDGSSLQLAGGQVLAPLGLAQQLIWKKEALPPGRHNLTLTHAGQQGQYFTLDFFRVLQNENSRVSSTPYSTAGTRTAIVGDMTPSNVAYGTKTSQTRLAVAIGVPLGIMLLGSLFAYLMVRRRGRRRQTSFIEHFYAPSMSQQLPTRGGGFVKSVATTSTAPPPPPLVPSAAPGSQSFNRPYLEWESFPLGDFDVPPPYQSPNSISRY